MDWQIGKPYSFRNFNCWDYVKEIRESRGIKTRAFQPVNIKNAFEIITAEMQKISHGLTRVQSPENFDVVIVHKKEGKKTLYHCGVFFNGEVRHCSRALRQVVNESFSDFKRQYDGFTLWR